MGADVADGHAAGVEAEDLVVQAGQPRLALGHDWGSKLPVAVARRLDLDRPQIGLQRLGASRRCGRWGPAAGRRADGRGARSARPPARPQRPGRRAGRASPPGPESSSGLKPRTASSSAPSGSSSARRSTTSCGGCCQRSAPSPRAPLGLHGAHGDGSLLRAARRARRRAASPLRAQRLDDRDPAAQHRDRSPRPHTLHRTDPPRRDRRRAAARRRRTDAPLRPRPRRRADAGPAPAAPRPAGRAPSGAADPRHHHRPGDGQQHARRLPGRQRAGPSAVRAAVREPRAAPQQRPLHLPGPGRPGVLRRVGEGRQGPRRRPALIRPATTPTTALCRTWSASCPPAASHSASGGPPTTSGTTKPAPSACATRSSESSRCPTR